MKRALLLLALVALPAYAQHKPWYVGTQKTGATQWGPVRDSGAAFPLVYGATGTVQTVIVPNATTFSTTATNAMIVVAVALGNYAATDQHSVTVAWTAAVGSGCTETFTKRVEYLSSAQSHGASIWTATCTTAVAAKSITVTAVASATSVAASVAVDALSSYSTVGASNGVARSGSAGVLSTTLTGTTSGSWVYVAGLGEDQATLAEVAGTLQLDERVYNVSNVVAATGINRTQSAATVGWSTTSSWGAVAALEIKGP